jgi:dihydroflavonol-4-reductase
VLNACKNGLDAVIVCPTGVIGPFDYRGSEMGVLIRDLMKQRLNFLIEGSYDFVDVRDVAHGLILAAEKGRAGELYILSGEPISIEGLRDCVQAENGNRGVSIRLPLVFARFIARLTPPFYRALRIKPRFTLYSINTVAGNSTISHAKATRELGYQPRSLIATIDDTVRWWSAHLNRQRSLRTG